jgi:hypothetical protein
MIDIQNNNFTQQLNEFKPKQLVTAVATEMRDLLHHEPRLKFHKVPKLLLGDSARVKYILLCLMQTAVDRNKENLKFRTLEMVKVSVSVSDD